jgi:hypothetical protein
MKSVRNKFYDSASSHIRSGQSKVLDDVQSELNELPLAANVKRLPSGELAFTTTSLRVSPQSSKLQTVNHVKDLIR